MRRSKVGSSYLSLITPVRRNAIHWMTAAIECRVHSVKLFPHTQFQCKHSEWNTTCWVLFCRFVSRFLSMYVIQPWPEYFCIDDVYLSSFLHIHTLVLVDFTRRFDKIAFDSGTKAAATNIRLAQTHCRKVFLFDLVSFRLCGRYEHGISTIGNRIN